MAISAERHQEVDVELEAMWKRLIELSVEIEAAAPHTDKRGFTYQLACSAGDAVALLRHQLRTQQENMRMGAEIQRRLYGKAKY